MPFQSNPADLISRGIEPTKLSTSTLWWTRPQWPSQEPSSWPTTEINTHTDYLKMRNVHIACLQTQEDITKRFCKLKKLNRVVAYCKRFISNCRNSKANRQSSILSTQNHELALTCYVKRIQLNPYAQEIRNLMEK